MVINYQKIYEKLGYLFYALAGADGKVRSSEEDSLQRAVESMWLSYEDSTDEFDMDAAEYILIAFDYLMAEGVDPRDAYGVFEEYYREHSTVFDKTMKRKIMSTAYMLANAFGSENHKEIKMLHDLENLLGLAPTKRSALC